MHGNDGQEKRESASNLVEDVGTAVVEIADIALGTVAEGGESLLEAAAEIVGEILS